MPDWTLGRYASPIGPITLACGGDGLKGLWFDGQKHFGAGLTGGEREGDSELARRAAAWLDGYFAGKTMGQPDFPLAPEGTPFQMEVWRLLTEIPRGQVATYGRLAERLSERLGRQTSARAVGGAVGRNPISIMIPCHRVIGARGSMTGYAGGVERKSWLLRLEGAPLGGMNEPSGRSFAWRSAF